MSGFYRFEFVRGPHDGLAVEGNTLVAPRLELPIQQGAVDSTSPRIPAALYELSAKALRWEEGGPQAVLRYEFRGSPGRARGANRLIRWLADRRHRVARWMMTPVSYPMTTRSE
ncbi:MAG TPA: hypothetical protein VHY91_13120 [Pirellulales bacterium]|nr:hypothetical protein [Pirellulales bacterium]